MCTLYNIYIYIYIYIHTHRERAREREKQKEIGFRVYIYILYTYYLYIEACSLRFLVKFMLLMYPKAVLILNLLVQNQRFKHLGPL